MADLSEKFGVRHELPDPGVLCKVRLDECLAQGLGLRVYSSEFGGWGYGFMAQSLGVGVLGLELSV